MILEQVRVLLEDSRILRVKADTDGDVIHSIEIITADGDIVIIHGDGLSMDVVYNRVGDHRKSKKQATYCTCCGHECAPIEVCPTCGAYVCQDCMPDFGAHFCGPG